MTRAALIALLALPSIVWHPVGVVGAAAAPRALAGAAFPWPQISFASPIEGFENPVDIENAGDGTGRLFVVEQGGRIRIVKDGVISSTPFLDISGRVGCQGLFTVAFPPDYESSGSFYAAFEDASCSLVVARYRVTSNPDTADPGSEDVVLTVPMAEPGEGGHSGSKLAFGPIDGYLYVSIGDGSHGGDPGNLAQNPGTLLGKLLRIDVRTADPATYTIPPTNPFVGVAGYREEIWAVGLRNPWRYSFDRQTGDLYLADVGEDAFEEVNYQPASSSGGENYGWRIMEGSSCFGASTCDSAGLTLPVAEYDHAQGCSVTGGYVYRGTLSPTLQGIYFYGDYCNGRIWGLRRGDAGWETALLSDTTANIVGFGESESGELFLADRQGGTIYRISDTPPSSTDVSVTKSDSPDPVARGQKITYTIQATNEGPASATGVDVVDELPQGVSFISATPTQGTCLRDQQTITCDVGQIAVGTTITVTIEVNTSTSTPSTVTDTATVTANEPDPDPSDNVATQATTVSSGGGTVQVNVTDAGFSPQSVSIQPGTTVQWTFGGSSDQTVTDASGMGLFDSGPRAPGSTYSFTFIAAANYSYKDGLHSTLPKGTVKAALLASPASGTTATTFTISWSSAAPPAGYAFDVQIRRPGSTTFVAWRTGVTIVSDWFNADAGAGKYSFRARIRNTSNGKAAKFSGARTISVS